MCTCLHASFFLLCCYGQDLSRCRINFPWHHEELACAKILCGPRTAHVIPRMEVNKTSHSCCNGFENILLPLSAVTCFNFNGV